MDVVDVVGRVVVGFVEQFFEHGHRWVGLQCSDQGGNPRDCCGQIRQNILAVDGTKMGGGGGRLKGAETHGNWRRRGGGGVAEVRRNYFNFINLMKNLRWIYRGVLWRGLHTA